MKSTLLTVAGALALVLATTFPSGAAAQDHGPITVYNAQHRSLTQAWVDGFTKETGVKVVVRNGGDTEMGNQIIQEGAASPADVFLTENSPAMALVDAARLFAPVDADTLAQVPDAYRAKDGHWIGIAARATVFAYNKDKLSKEQLPKSMLDLADPSWKGRWAASPSGADFGAIVAALLQLKGEQATKDWLQGMDANAKTYKGNSVAMKAVNAGQVDAALIYHYYWFADQAKTGENSGNVALHYFRDHGPGAFVSISGGGVLASSKHKAEAQAFLKWVTGKHGQAILRTGDSFEYAVGRDDASNPALVPLAALDAPKIEPSQLDSKKVNQMMMAAGLL